MINRIRKHLNTKNISNLLFNVLENIFFQNFWFLTPIPASRIGYARAGVLVMIRRKKHRALQRQIHIAILQYHRSGPSFGALIVHWINERCKLCSASYNSRVEEADVIWINSQDPLDKDSYATLVRHLDRARPNARIINHPNHYNAYYQDDAFERLSRAGVSVPRYAFSDKDRGATRVVYKREGCQAAPKTMEIYQGERKEYRAFEFIDSRGPDGLYRRYRTFYLIGLVRPSKLMVSNHWNVCLKHKTDLYYTFTMTDEEVRQVKLIADALQLEYFAVDFLRRHGDDAPFFTDVNVYPTIRSVTKKSNLKRDYGFWHTFDTRDRLAIPEPGGNGRPFAEQFDEAMVGFINAG